METLLHAIDTAPTLMLMLLGGVIGFGLSATMRPEGPPRPLTETEMFDRLVAIRRQRYDTERARKEVDAEIEKVAAYDN